MLGLKLNHVSERGHRRCHKWRATAGWVCHLCDQSDHGRWTCIFRLLQLRIETGLLWTERRPYNNYNAIIDITLKSSNDLCVCVWGGGGGGGHMHSWWTISENNIDVMGFKPLCVWVSDCKYLFILAPSMKKTEWVMFAFNACIVCVYVCMCVCVGERERERYV